MFKRVTALICVIILPLFILGIYYWFFYSREQSIVYQDRLRTYRIHLPLGGQGSSARPLLIMLHGYGDHPRLAEFYSQFSSLSDNRKFIVVYPYGTKGSEDGNLSWNAKYCCALAMRDNVDDVGFINKLTDELSRKYQIDPGRIYLAGYSNGAMLAYRITAETPGKYAAIAVVSGTIGGESFPNNIYSQIPDLKEPLSLIAFHGEKDLVVPYLGGENVYQNKSGLAKFVSFNRSVEFVSRSGGCSAPSISTPFVGVTLESYTDCLPGSEIAAYTLSGRGHIWPGGLFESSIYGRTSGLFASGAIWDFFLRHSLKQ